MKHPTALIAEDEAPQRHELTQLLGELWPELQITALCEDGLSALEALKSAKPDIALLDIRMPGLSGMELIRHIGPTTQVIFITAFAEHALRAFEEGAIDYLLKPVSRQRLQITVERAKSRFTANFSPDLAQLLQALQTHTAALPPPARWVSASIGNTIRMFPIDDILFFQSQDKYTRVVTGAEEAVIRTPLKELVGMLDPDVFWQVHRSVIVRVAAIRVVVRTSDDRYEMSIAGCADRLPVSAAFKERFKGM